MSFLDGDIFRTIVANTPLIAIDLVVEDEHGCITDSVFDEVPDTHYVVVAHHLRVQRADLCLPQEQHSDFRWWSKEEMAVADNVHLNSRIYLDKIEGKRGKGKGKGERGKEGESRYKVKARH